jgi:hypothetical protein
LAKIQATQPPDSLSHLVMPGMLAETEAVLRFVAEELGPDTYVDLMAQYYPAGLVGKGGRDGYAEIDRHLYREEYLRAVDLGLDLGCGWTSGAWPARPGWLPPTLRPDRCRAGATCPSEPGRRRRERGALPQRPDEAGAGRPTHKQWLEAAGSRRL